MASQKTREEDIANRTPDPLLGQRFLRALNSLLSSAKIHLDNNKLIQDSAHNFTKIIEEILSVDDEINFLITPGGFFLQQEKIRLQRNSLGLASNLLKFFNNRQIEGLRFKKSTKYTPQTNLLLFIRFLNKCKKHKDPTHWLVTKLEKEHYNWIELINTSQAQSLESIFEATKTSSSPVTEKTDSILNRKRKKRTLRACATYGGAIDSLKGIAHRLASNINTGMGKSVQHVQDMVDQIIDDENVLLDLATIRDYDDYTFTHSINVSILSLCLGHRIGLKKRPLARLGLSALFHDLGKIDIPKNILNKPGKLTSKEFRIIQNHSLYSVRRILRLRASHDRKAGIMLAPFEHHLRYDLTGYPKTPRKTPISLFGRIITIADVYDAVTAPRIYRKTCLSQDKALGLMLKDSGKIFDPILLKVFINMLGIYPVGTVLVLESGQLVLVAHPPEEVEDKKALWGIHLKREKSGGYLKGKYINLGNWNPDTKAFKQRIQQTHHPADLGIQPAEFLLAL